MTSSLPLHDSAWLHVRGEARYVEDLPRLEGELTVAVVGAPCARGRLISVRVDTALELEGVATVLAHRDIPGVNRWGPIFQDEPFLVEDEISYLGQPVAIVVAESKAVAGRARDLVVLEVEAREPLLSIDEAVSKGSFLGVERRIDRGDLEAGQRQASQKIQGVFRSNGQDQFYLESQAALAIPEERDTVLIHSSTQNPTEIQKVTAELLGWRQNQVTCVVKRMGGAFGGKETQAALPAAFTALAAHHTGRPVRLVYDKDTDMRITGKRHEYRTEYRVDFDDEGRIWAADFKVHSNGGAFADLSTAVLERTMLHLDNAYYLPNVGISAQVCKTNLPPNTAFRGFGGPQAMAVIENVMEEIAVATGRDASDVRRANLYSDDPESERAVTPYGQRVTNNLLPEIFDRLEETSSYRARRAAIEGANSDLEVSLRGLAMVPVKFGISFTNKTLNQGNALVNVYTDGTVQVSTGATEMGQGVNTKLAQIVAQELGLHWDRVVVMPTSTEKNNNTSPTAASASTDLNGSAAVIACQKIRKRLAELAATLFADPGGGLVRSPAHVRFADNRVWDERAPQAKGVTFAELTRIAHVERVDLGARGFYATPGVDFNRDTGKGTPFAYYTTGCCVAEVRIDRLLGTLRLLGLDVLMDIGKPINLGIERGQVIGGLIQGIGWVTTEELVYDHSGALLSHSPTTYKIPNITDLPGRFEVDFLDNDLNRQNLRSTKAVGEPPLMLAIAVWCAIKDALSYAGASGERTIAELSLPATHEEIARCAERMERSTVESGPISR